VSFDDVGSFTTAKRISGAHDLSEPALSAKREWGLM